MRLKLWLATCQLTSAAAIAGAGLLTSAIPLSAHAGQLANSFGGQAQTQAQAQAGAQATWRENIKQVAPPTTGCFHASYPSMTWARVVCGPEPTNRSARPAPRRKIVRAEDGLSASIPDTAGNGNDYIIKTTSAIISAVGSFPSATGITSEKGVNNPEYAPDVGITGSNQYTLQLNSNQSTSAAACSNFGYASCTVWEQFVYSTNNNYDPSAPNASGSPAEPQVFIQNWVYPSANDYSNLGCPSGWGDATDSNGAACYTNSSATTVPAVAASQLASLKLSGSASVNGNDTVTFTDGTEAYSASQPGNTTDLGAWWNSAEFNLVGNGGGSVATFNKGVSITLKIAVNDGSTAAPKCGGPSITAANGATGESNNLTLSKTCTASAGTSTTSPSIQFTESD
ncbi:hypothetical protein [Burkholderia alba]|uniref:hypothetical protein n=1 Tax=Burkholderia alba TaxID=2683677 RepID=UPI002B05C378|nr:hypothetical protein [Burkholderia alba]